MKILELPAYFLPHKGGIESIVYHLSKELVKLGNKVKVITSNIGSDKLHDNMDGFRIKRVPAFQLMQDSIAPKLFFKLENADIAHIHHPHAFWIYTSYLYCRFKKIPYVIHMHGKEIEFQGIKSLISKTYNFIFLDPILRNSKAILTHTKKVIHQSKYLKKYYHKIKYIPHGIELKAITNIKKENKKRFILTVGVRDYKRIDILIRAMAIILKETDIELIIAGDGPEKMNLQKLTQKLNLTNKIKFLGYISEEKKYQLYQQAQVFVLPSPTIMESFGTVAFEAFSMKCPVIITSGAGVSEIFEKENIGIITRPYDIQGLADNILKILKNKKLAKSVGEKGYNVIKNKYQWVEITKQYQKLFRSILKLKGVNYE